MEVGEKAVGAMQVYLRLKRYILPSGIAREALQAAVPFLSQPSAARELALEEAARVAEQFRNNDWIAHDMRTGVFPKQSEPGVAIAAAIRALSSPDHADAGKIEGDGWSMSPPKFHRYPYSVENISGEWCLRKHHGNGASHTISVHETAREARDAAPASEGAE
ncbi:hypothetical protein [Brucella intermedia]|uniref:hypothetical protein n=1 Tax=Brucella intermedia TaxID=94625 RepID=UPI0021C8A1AE|nr:hypothetical protein [Brucella intermedia]UXO85625.1 hypothetical protein N8I72_14775 [Brucella intermedia]